MINLPHSLNVYGERDFRKDSQNDLTRQQNGTCKSSCLCLFPSKNVEGGDKKKSLRGTSMIWEFKAL